MVKANYWGRRTNCQVSVPRCRIVLRPTAASMDHGEGHILLCCKPWAKGFVSHIGRIKQQQLSFVYVKDLAIVAISALFAP